MYGRHLTLTAGCKINLTLRITGRREDGYHTLESLFLPLRSPCDTITVTPAPGTGNFSLTCSDPALSKSGNLLELAYMAYARRTGFSPSLAVHLQKNIPYGAGLGGGSSDAAAFLRYLNNSAQENTVGSLSEEELRKLAVGLGADVPFFLLNRPANVTGIGDILQEIDNPVAGLHIVLICPNIHVSTPWAFAEWDKKNDKNHERGLTSGQEQDTSPFVCGICVQNDLRDVVFGQYPQLGQIIDLLHRHNALAAEMSGSGSSIFGLFTMEADAAEAVMQCKNEGLLVFSHRL